MPPLDHDRRGHSGRPSEPPPADRGWWASVEIVRNRPRRKTLIEALELLGSGFERYDIIVHNGKTLARGLFDASADPASLARLLELCGRWNGTRALLEALPQDSALWIPTRQRIRTRWECRFPPVVPRRDTGYDR